MNLSHSANFNDISKAAAFGRITADLSMSTFQ
jgi:hypothetical protein